MRSTSWNIWEHAQNPEGDQVLPMCKSDSEPHCEDDDVATIQAHADFPRWFLYHKQKYAEFCTVMVSICITPSYWKTKSAVYDFVNGCIHGYAFCSQILLKLSNWNMFKFLSVPVLNGSRVWDYKNINPQTSTACQIPHYCNTWTPGQLARNLNKQFCSVRASHHCRLQQHIRSARRIVFSSLVERGC